MVLDRILELKQNTTPQQEKQFLEAVSRLTLTEREVERGKLWEATEMGIDAKKSWWEYTDDELERIFEYGHKEQLPIVTPLICAIPTIEFLLSRFHCDRCGRCCQELPPVPILRFEVNKIADYFGVSHKAIKRKLICENGEKKLPMPCPFYDNGCSVQRVKPNACHLFPLVEPVIINGTALITILPFCDASIRLCWDVAGLIRNMKRG